MWTRKKVITLRLGIVILTFILLYTAVSLFFPPCDRLTCITMTGLAGWKEKEVYEHTKTMYRALLSDPNFLIRVEKNAHLSSDDAALMTKVNIMKVTGLFDDARSPYPGAISDRIRCDTAYRPIVQRLNNATTEVTYYTARLNERLQIGSCLESEIVFRSYTAYFYCGQEKALYHVELIAKRDADDQAYTTIIQSIRCQKPNLWNMNGAFRQDNTI